MALSYETAYAELEAGNLSREEFDSLKERGIIGPSPDERRYGPDYWPIIQDAQEALTPHQAALEAKGLPGTLILQLRGATLPATQKKKTDGQQENDPRD